MHDIQMQTMPQIWDEGAFWTSVKEIKGELASWGIRQSPYGMPEHLTRACQEMADYFTPKADATGFLETSCKALRKEIRQAIDACPAMQAWNVPKKGDHQIVFSSRYDHPHPDYDFIDLDALARNIAHSITVAHKYEQAQDRWRDAGELRHAKEEE